MSNEKKQTNLKVNENENNDHQSSPHSEELSRGNENGRPTSFTRDERFNIILYILGIMFFKFAFETLT